ncbi:hypothetical protein [Sphingomonas sp. PAMC 26605]|uniref:hypothetical protein n=1 Tax=Sphingomonas sp. PAMC 26605 TaxID=1112214 RepID=UPI0012F47F1C|nr:hypothetical protein [Sphingomonas sp. PAMC 26605]
MDFLRCEVDVDGRVAVARLSCSADLGRGPLGRLLVFARDDRGRLVRVRPNLCQGEHHQREDHRRYNDDDKHRPDPLEARECRRFDRGD